MRRESLGKIQVLVSNTLIGVQVPASAPAMYGFSAIISALRIHEDTPLGTDSGTNSKLTDVPVPSLSIVCSFQEAVQFTLGDSPHSSYFCTPNLTFRE